MSRTYVSLAAKRPKVVYDLCALVCEEDRLLLLAFSTRKNKLNTCTVLGQINKM